MNNRKLKKLLRENMLYKDEVRESKSSFSAPTWFKSTVSVLAAVAIICISWIAVVRFVGPESPGSTIYPGSDPIDNNGGSSETGIKVTSNDLTQDSKPNVGGTGYGDDIGATYPDFNGKTLRVVIADVYCKNADGISEFSCNEMTGNIFNDIGFQRLTYLRDSMNVDFRFEVWETETFAERAMVTSSLINIYIAPLSVINELNKIGDSSINFVSDYFFNSIAATRALHMNTSCFYTPELSANEISESDALVDGIYNAVMNDSFDLAFLNGVIEKCKADPKLTANFDITYSRDEFETGKFAFYIGDMITDATTIAHDDLWTLPIPQETGSYKLEINADAYPVLATYYQYADSYMVERLAAEFVDYTNMKRDEIIDCYVQRNARNKRAAEIFRKIYPGYASVGPDFPLSPDSSLTPLY